MLSNLAQRGHYNWSSSQTLNIPNSPLIERKEAAISQENSAENKSVQNSPVTLRSSRKPRPRSLADEADLFERMALLTSPNGNNQNDLEIEMEEAIV